MTLTCTCDLIVSLLIFFYNLSHSSPFLYPLSLLHLQIISTPHRLIWHTPEWENTTGDISHGFLFYHSFSVSIHISVPCELTQNWFISFLSVTKWIRGKSERSLLEERCQVSFPSLFLFLAPPGKGMSLFPTSDSQYSQSPWPHCLHSFQHDKSFSLWKYPGSLKFYSQLSWGTFHKTWISLSWGCTRRCRQYERSIRASDTDWLCVSTWHS